jgi:Na+/H+-dicarboxylate symporter/ABC-type amino acid transport substrate-binding protein
LVATDEHRDPLFARLLWAIGAGVLAGLFFGEQIGPLGIVADGFVRLLQVNVLPYLLGSLIASLGSRGSNEVKAIARYGLVLLLVVWGLGLAFVAASQLAFPPFAGVPVFGLGEPVPPVDWLELYIPSNLFHSLANNLIPAVVVFGILAGLALGQMRGPNKEILLNALSAFNEAMARVSRMILGLMPYGLFAIAAVTAGELRVEDLLRLQIWFHLYAGGTLLFTLWLLPALVARTTGIGHRRFLRAMRESIVTAAAAGDVLVVLPLIAESTKRLLVENGSEEDAARHRVGVAIPLLYNFPHVGKILSLAFLPFAAWLSGAALDVSQLLLVATAGPLSLFGSINAAMPFLLDLLRLPADLFEVFTVSSVVNSRLGSMTAATHTAALGVIVAIAMMDGLRVPLRRIARFGLVTAAAVALFVAGTRVVFTWLLPPEPSGLATLSTFVLRPPLVAPGAAAGTEPGAAPEPGRRLEQIRERGVLRVGYFAEAMPWAFVNAGGELVGYDVEAAHRLAAQLEVAVAFVRVDRAAPEPSRALAEGRVDILMTGFTATVSRAERMELSHSYAVEHVGLLVRDFDRARFDSLAALKGGSGITIAVPTIEGATDLIESALPGARTRGYQNIEEVLRNGDVTAVLTTMERAYYWSRVHPEFSAVRPRDLRTGTIVVYGLPYGEIDFRNLVNVWIETRRANGDADEAYDYWVRGRGLSARAPRWSVLSDVLGWR